MTRTHTTRERAFNSATWWLVECDLVDRAALAYALARREVFDVLDSQLTGITPHQAELLSELQAAEGELAQWRAGKIANREIFDDAFEARASCY